MPSDCQCSTPSVEYVDRIKVLNNKQATRKIARLEKEVEALRSENAILKRKARSKTLTKKKLVGDLKRHLDRI